MALTANEYKTELSGTTTTGSLISADFGFDANYVRVANDGVVPVHVTFASSVATTAHATLKGGEVVEWRLAATHVLGITTTSSSTDGTDHRQVRVLALGG